MRYVEENLGDGYKRHAVYGVPTINNLDYWVNVTDIECPVCKTGTVRWDEAGHVPGSRICDTCGRFFQAIGSIGKVSLMRDVRFDRKALKA